MGVYKLYVLNCIVQANSIHVFKTSSNLPLSNLKYYCFPVEPIFMSVFFIPVSYAEIDKFS